MNFIRKAAKACRIIFDPGVLALSFMCDCAGLKAQYVPRCSSAVKRCSDTSKVVIRCDAYTA